jgi:hypothetical protein
MGMWDLLLLLVLLERNKEEYNAEIVRLAGGISRSRSAVLVQQLASLSLSSNVCFKIIILNTLEITFYIILDDASLRGYHCSLKKGTTVQVQKILSWSIGYFSCWKRYRFSRALRQHQ